MNSDRINLRRRKQEGTPECQINLKNRKAMIDRFRDAYEDMNNWEVEHIVENLAEICIKHANEIQSGANRK